MRRVNKTSAILRGIIYRFLSIDTILVQSVGPNMLSLFAVFEKVERASNVSRAETVFRSISSTNSIVSFHVSVSVLQGIHASKAVTDL